MGEWEDLSWGDIEWRWPDELERFSNDPMNWRAPGSEHFLELRRRLTDAMDDIAAQNPGRTVAVFSHGCAIRAFLSGLVNGETGGVDNVPHSDNTNVSLIEYDETGRRLAFYRGQHPHSRGNQHLCRTEMVEGADGAGQHEHALFQRAGGYGEISALQDSRRCRRLNLPSSPAMTRTIPSWPIPARPRGLCRAQERGGRHGGLPPYTWRRDCAGSGMSVQLIGEAVSRFRRRGMNRVVVRIPATMNGRNAFSRNMALKAGAAAGESVIFTRSIAVENGAC